MRCVTSDRHAVCAHAVCRVLCGVSRAYGVCVCVYARMGRGDGRTDEGVCLCVLASCVRS